MARLLISENISLDGVVEDPNGDEGFKHGGWFMNMSEQDRAEFADVGLQEALEATALLMGRRTYEGFAARWSSRSGEWADRLNSLPKYVVSSQDAGLNWNNSTLVSGDVASEVAALRETLPGTIVVYGSRRLVQTLIENDLVDEMRLTVHPYVIGSGDRLFGEYATSRPARLIENRPLGSRLAYMRYAVDHED